MYFLQKIFRFITILLLFKTLFFFVGILNFFDKNLLPKEKAKENVKSKNNTKKLIES